ncbi:signal transduction histidine kinase [Bosea sp. AK1]|uniref:sensor histidine kinase n=1 Tax=Bosea sp. AK1 TaxID=2587160 RepID=UPI00114D97A0|nr:ATP-binding protein [Bosea sp. AK1]TQI65220.1 signal transduction histidine kinase [Bosea sp. AK1]
MAFNILARTILELGAELISSDGIALYELLKNSIDAGSRQVRIEVQVALRHSYYQGALAEIENGIGEYRNILEDGDRENASTYRFNKLREIKEFVLSSIDQKYMDDLQQLIIPRLNDSRSFAKLKDSLKWIYTRINWISVTDWGEGMSLADLQNVYLTIGTRSRQKEKSARGASDAGRVYLGEKGVGRLSTMRLGSRLRIRTTTNGEARVNNLDVNWSRFSHDSDRPLSDIMIRPRRGALKSDRAEQGTTVTILDLSSDWTEDKFREIVISEFSRLIDPFEGRGAARILRLYFNGTRHHPLEIEQKLFEIAHAEVNATFRYEDQGPVLRGHVNYRLRGRERSFVMREAELRGQIGAALWPALLNLGPFDVEFWWYNRSALTDLPGLGNKREVQRRVARWTGGLMLFRDGFRINPYGGPDDDWLGLDKKAFSSRGFKLNRQQVIGRVAISWKNPALIDQTNREGLTETPEKAVLVALLQQILFNQFKVHLDTWDREVRVQDLTTTDDLQAHVERAQSEIGRKLRELSLRVPAERAAIVELHGLFRRLDGYVQKARTLAEEYENDRGKFVYLAGIGLMVEFILHELGRATSHTLRTLRSIEAANFSNPAELQGTFRTLDDQLATLVKRIETLDPLSTSRRQRKEDFNVFEVVQQVVEGRQDQARRHGISFRGNFGDLEILTIRGVRGMFVQIIENLLSNAFFWLGVQSEIDPETDMFIEINIDSDNEAISVTDGGTGVDPAAADEIFEAFVSHRPANSGRGLGLYISREIAGYHDWTLSLKKENTVRRGRFNTFILNLSADGR